MSGYKEYDILEKMELNNYDYCIYYVFRKVRIEINTSYSHQFSTRTNEQVVIMSMLTLLSRYFKICTRDQFVLMKLLFENSLSLEQDTIIEYYKENFYQDVYTGILGSLPENKQRAAIELFNSQWIGRFYVAPKLAYGDETIGYNPNEITCMKLFVQSRDGVVESKFIYSFFSPSIICLPLALAYTIKYIYSLLKTRICLYAP